MATNYQAQVDQYNKKIAEAQANGGKTSSGVTLSQLQSGLASAQSKLNSNTTPTASVSNGAYATGSAAGPATLSQYQTSVSTNKPVYIPTSTPTVTSVPTVSSNRSSNSSNAITSPIATVPTAMDLGYNIPVTNAEKLTGIPQSVTENNYAIQNPIANTNTAQATQQYNPTDSFVEKMKIIQQMFYPQKEQAPAYVSPYGDSINSLISLITGRVSNPGSYNPTTDAGLKVAQEDAVKASRTALGRRGMIGSGSGIYGQQGEIQAAQRLIPQYQQMYQQNEQQKTNNLFNQLSAIQGIENNKYNQYRDQVGDVNNKNQMNVSDILSLANLTGTVSNQDLTQQQYSDSRSDTSYTKGLQQSKLIQDAYGIYVDPALLNPLTAQESANVTTLMNSLNLQNKTDYQEAMNTVGQNNPMYGVLQRARAQKIASDPKLLSQYGGQIGSQTLSGQQAQLSNVSQALQNNILKAKSDNAGVIAKKELELLELQLSMGKIDEDTKRIASKYLDSKAQAEIDSIRANTRQSNASADAVIMNAQTNIAELDYKKSQGTSEKNLTTQQKNEYYADAYQKIRVLPVAQAKTALINGRQELESTMGNSQYKALVNDVLRAAGITYEQLFEE